MAERTAMQTVVELDLNSIAINKNVRTEYREDALKELADSIKVHGLKQPITVYENPANMGHYFIKWGHRRYLASKNAGKLTISAFISTVIPDDLARIEEQLIENIIREDPPDRDIEAAIAALVGDSPEHGQLAKVAASLGKPKAYVTRALEAWRIRSGVSPKVQLFITEWGSRAIYDLFHSLPSQGDPVVAIGAFEALIAQKAGWPSKEEEAAEAAKKADEHKDVAPPRTAELDEPPAASSPSALPAEDDAAGTRRAEGAGTPEPSVIQRAAAIRATPPSVGEARGEGGANLPDKPRPEESARSPIPFPAALPQAPPLIEWQVVVTLAQNKHPVFKVKSVRANFNDIPERAKALFNEAFTLIDEAYASR
jgi:ParB/RepB/Spo0J family partition protein